MIKKFDDYLVGEEDCSFDAIVSAMLKIENSDLIQQWSSIARSLKIKEVGELEATSGSSSIRNILFKVLERFRSNCSNQAKLSVLVDVLKNHGFNQIATSLIDTFCKNFQLEENTGERDITNVDPELPEERDGVKIIANRHNGSELENSSLIGSLEGYKNKAIESRRLKSIILMLVCVLLLLAVLLVVIVIFLHISYRNMGGSVTGEVGNTSKMEPFIQKSVLVTIRVRNHSDYVQKMLQSPKETPISLKVNLDSNSWPNTSMLVNTSMIKYLELEGIFDNYQMLSLLHGMSNLESLSITNNSGYICSKDKARWKEKIILKKLTFLQLRNFRNCPSFFLELSLTIEISSLNILQYDRGRIDQSNLYYIQTILKNSRNSLASIQFSNTDLLVNPINKNLGTLGSVTKFYVVPASENNSEYISPNIRYIFPKLQEFQLNGSISLEQFYRLSKCKHLQSISVGITLTADEADIDMSDLAVRFPSLREANLKMFFSYYPCRLRVRNGKGNNKKIKISLSQTCVVENLEKITDVKVKYSYTP